jgi:hypothetical protein
MKNRLGIVGISEPAAEEILACWFPRPRLRYFFLDSLLKLIPHLFDVAFIPKRKYDNNSVTHLHSTANHKNRTN